MDMAFAIQPYRVDEAGFRSCDITSGEAVVEEPTSDTITVPQRFIQPGINYFISKSRGAATLYHTSAKVLDKMALSRHE